MTSTTTGHALRPGCVARENDMTEMDVNEVLAHLPQRYPFLMIDRVKEIEPGKRIVAIKNVSANEPYFPGHFPHHPIMPGVLILEAMAQAAGVLVFRTSNTLQLQPDLCRVGLAATFRNLQPRP